MRTKTTILAFFVFVSFACAQTMKESLFNMVSNCYNAWKAVEANANDDED